MLIAISWMLFSVLICLVGNVFDAPPIIGAGAVMMLLTTVLVF